MLHAPRTPRCWLQPFHATRSLKGHETKTPVIDNTLGTAFASTSRWIDDYASEIFGRQSGIVFPTAVKFPTTLKFPTNIDLGGGLGPFAPAATTPLFMLLVLSPSKPGKIFENSENNTHSKLLTTEIITGIGNHIWNSCLLDKTAASPCIHKTHHQLTIFRYSRSTARNTLQITISFILNKQVIKKMTNYDCHSKCHC